MSASRWIAVSALVVATSALAAEPTPISVCGSGANVGILTQDIDCSTYQGPSPILAIGRELDLNGHTIIGNPDLALSNPDRNVTVVCLGSCKIYGPGTIIGSSRGSVATEPPYRYRAQLENVTIDSSIVIPGSVGVQAQVVRITNSTLRHHGTGVRGGKKAMLRDSTVAENYWSGIECTAIRLDGVSVTDNGQVGVMDEFEARKSIISNSMITGNRLGGVSSYGGVTIKSSIIENNCEEPYCDMVFDLATCYEPRLIDTQCGMSWNTCTQVPVSWGVCALD